LHGWHTGYSTHVTKIDRARLPQTLHRCSTIALARRNNMALALMSASVISSPSQIINNIPNNNIE
jgi:hypothetical protein